MRFAWPGAVVSLAASAVFLVGNEPSPALVAGTTTSTSGQSDASADLVPTSAKPAQAPRSGLSIRKIETVQVDGGEDFVIVFDGPLPDDRVSHVRDIEHVDAPAIAFTTQEWTPDNPTPLRTCADTHGGFNPPTTVGQADVLMPADWFTAPPDTEKIIWKQHPKGYGRKTPLCGPHNGYVQFAIWAPASHDPDDIRVYVDGTARLTIEIRPGRG